MIVFISSPYSGDIEKNVEAARRYCRFVVDNGQVPIAPHLLFPQFMDEESERALAFKMGLRLLDLCDELWAFVGNQPEWVISPGMSAEIEYAEDNLIPVCYVKL